jgi:hypothetical protein
VKNQNFGDNRDLLKFDLVCQIAKTGMVDQFTYIPMLTENEERKEEPQFCRHEATGGGGNVELTEFLDRCIINEKRDIGQLEEFFLKCGIKTTVYEKDKLFTITGRKNYFDNIRKGMLTKSLILADPDKGLEEEFNGPGNLLFSELKDLYDRMDDGSCLMFTQRFADDMYEEYLEMRCADIQDQIPGSQPISLDDLDTIIFFLTKSEVMQSRLIQFLKEYTMQYANTGRE